MPGLLKLGIALSLSILIFSCAEPKSSDDVVSPESAEEEIHTTDGFDINRENFETKIVLPTELAKIDSEGLSQTSFSVELIAGEKTKTVAIPFHFESKFFSTMTVKRPSLIVAGCNKKADVAKYQLGKAIAPIFLWSEGWVHAEEAKAITVYGIPEKTSKNLKETIVLLLEVPSHCTQVSGSFETQFE